MWHAHSKKYSAQYAIPKKYCYSTYFCLSLYDGMQHVENGDRKTAGKQSLSWHVCETPPCVFLWLSFGNWLCVTTYAIRVAHGAMRKKKKTTESSSGMAWSEQSLEKRKKFNIIACDKILPFHPPATSHSAICPELVTADAWVAGGMFRRAPCGGRRE